MIRGLIGLFTMWIGAAIALVPLMDYYLTPFLVIGPVERLYSLEVVVAALIVGVAIIGVGVKIGPNWKSKESSRWEK